MRLLDLKSKIIIFLFLIGITSCIFPKEVVVDPLLFKCSDLVVPHKTLNGWWVYGEGQHIFKDEDTLEEYDLVFPNENIEELVELYLSVCEMEYFPMECQMIGILSDSILSVQEFEILYIQGCGE
tara:strand:- start:5 stop:379 length:375 start_codon:yes stop_codon:yes gene_type:complete